MPRLTALAVPMAASLLVLVTQPAAAQWAAPRGYAAVIPDGCPLEKGIYAACEDQMKLFSEAVARSRESGRQLLVFFGADWCPWCRRFNKLLGTGVLEEKDLAGRIDIVPIAVSVVSGGRKVDVTSGDDVASYIGEKTGNDIAVTSLPYFLLVDPKSESRVVAIPSGSFQSESSEGYDPGNVRKTLTAAMVALAK
jgi:thiol-disulfide isomerase/thioredoxin